MGITEQSRQALARYDLRERPEMEGELEATHAAFRVRAGDRPYVLRQFNPYVNAEDLRAQFLLARLIREAGINTPLPVRAKDGQDFVVVQARLWALFPWCHGRTGSADRVEDLGVLASVQGAWIECCERLRAHQEWQPTARIAQSLRRRKSWAWVAPLDQVPRFAKECMVVERARSAVSDCAHREAFFDLLPEVEGYVAEFEGLVRQQHIHELPHTVTHGDFWASNIRISEGEAAVLDLDCFSFEPRVTDFARAANWYCEQRSPSENAHLFRQFQARARLSPEEAEALPLMMCAHDLYYAVSHLLLWPEESDPEAQCRLIESIRSQAQAVDRYLRERDEILQTFLG